MTEISISYRIFFYWFATDTRWHFETITRGNAPSGCFKMSSGICSKPIEKYTVTHLYHSHAFVFFTVTAFEMDFLCLYRNHYLKKWNIKKEVSITITIPVSVSMDEVTTVSGTIFSHCTFNFTGLFYVWKF